MFSLGDSEVYYLSCTATDMRKGFDVLCGEVRRGMGRDPISGEVFIFYNSGRTRLKLLHWKRGASCSITSALNGVFLPCLVWRPARAVIKSCGGSWSAYGPASVTIFL